MSESTWFRSDTPQSKWHRLTHIFDGANGPKVLQAGCGLMIGINPDHPGNVLTTRVEPRKDRTCKKCLNIIGRP